jgi:hypothetical protein
MTTSKLTDVQRQAMAARDAAQAAGVGLSSYARQNGLNVRQVHDAVTGLRRRGILPPSERARSRRRKSGFVRVKVVNASTRSGADTVQRGGLVCRLIHGSGLIIECGEWPPASWLSAVLTERRDAAS